MLNYVASDDQLKFLRDLQLIKLFNATVDDVSKYSQSLIFLNNSTAVIHTYCIGPLAELPMEGLLGEPNSILRRQICEPDTPQVQDLAPGSRLQKELLLGDISRFAIPHIL